MKKHFFTNSEEIGNNMPHFTNNGFEVVKCPDSIWEVIMDLYKICLQAPVKEEPFAGLHNNAYLYDFEPYIGIVRHIHNSLLPLHEFWSNTILKPTAIWGIRSYTKGSQLMYHTDRPLTHHISCIVMVDKDLNGKEDWPLSIKGHDGKFYDVTSLQLLENKIIGHRESHRLVFTVKAESWNMGKVLKKIGD